MSSSKIFSPDELIELLLCFGHEADDVLARRLLQDDIFCFLLSSMKTVIQQAIEHSVSDTKNQEDAPCQVGEQVNTVPHSMDRLAAGHTLEQEGAALGENNAVLTGDSGAEVTATPVHASEKEYISDDTAGDVGQGDGEDCHLTEADLALKVNHDEMIVSSEKDIQSEVMQTQSAENSQPNISGQEQESASLSLDVVETMESEKSEQCSDVSMACSNGTITRDKELRAIRVTLPNGMCGREYDQVIPVEFRSVKGCVMPAELKMIFDESSGRVIGIPQQAGDYDLRFQGLLSDGEYSETSRSEEVFVIAHITVNPDPKSLWRDIPSDDTERFHKPDLASECFDVDHHRIMAASRRGRSHAHKGSHRDDEASVRYLPESGWYILGVADGAGSCPYSRRGSEIALKTAFEHLVVQLNGNVGNELVSACLDQSDQSSSFSQDTINALHKTLITAAFQSAKDIEREAEMHDLPIKDFSTTLLLLIYKKTEAGHLVASFSIGDGAIVAYDQSQGVQLLCVPDSGEFAGQTRFLEAGLFQKEDVYQRIKIALLPQFTSLMAMTDGITDAKFETEAMLSHHELWRILWDDIKSLLSGTTEQAQSAMLEWLNFWVVGNHDDRSIALITGDN